jgi:hypothetical protein
MFTLLSTTPLSTDVLWDTDVSDVADAPFQPNGAQLELVRTMTALYNSPGSSRGSDMATSTRATHAVGCSLSSDGPVTW